MEVLATIAAVALVLGIGYLAHVKGPDLRLALYYPVPVLGVAWIAGRRAGYAMAVFTTAVWYTVELHSAVKYSHAYFAVLNTTARLLVLLLEVLLLSEVRDMGTRLAVLVDERTRALRDLTIRLSQAEEFERERLAHDVHDGLGQSLTLLKLNLTAAISDSSSGSVPVPRLNEAVALVTNLIDHSRTLTFDLHPTMLTTLGLVPTLRQYAARFSQQTQIEVIVNEEGAARPVPPTMASYLFRSAKELMTNAAKHGDARQIIISAFWSSHRLRLIVDDDGSGFDPTTVGAGGANSGIGLAGIRERINALGGALSIESTLRLGSRIVLDLPLAAQEQA